MSNTTPVNTTRHARSISSGRATPQQAVNLFFKNHDVVTFIQSWDNKTALATEEAFLAWISSEAVEQTSPHERSGFAFFFLNLNRFMPVANRYLKAAYKQEVKQHIINKAVKRSNHAAK